MAKDEGIQTNVLIFAYLSIQLLVISTQLAFTGSTSTGKIVLELAARSNLKPVTLKLGGKSPFIVFEDADVDSAVETAHTALFLYQGQCCCAGSSTFVHERVYDEFVEKAKARALKRTVGDPFTIQGSRGDTKSEFHPLRACCWRFHREHFDTANTWTRALHAGAVWVNCFDVFDAAIPFGGYKMSWHGREKGIYSLSNYLQVKAVVTPVKNPAWL